MVQVLPFSAFEEDVSLVKQEDRFPAGNEVKNFG